MKRLKKELYIHIWLISFLGQLHATIFQRVFINLNSTNPFVFVLQLYFMSYLWILARITNFLVLHGQSGAPDNVLG